jgi:hypothetical protein
MNSSAMLRPKYLENITQIPNSKETPDSSTNKTDRHDIAEILLKVSLNSIKQTNNTYRLG